MATETRRQACPEYFALFNAGFGHFVPGDNTFRLNGEKWTVPKDNFHPSVASVDYALKFLVDEPPF
ncbi:MAG: hypothetical protein QNL68_07625 [Akkermansiaceae bacterium]